MSKGSINKYMEIGHAIMTFSKQFKTTIKTDLGDNSKGFAEAVTLLALLERGNTGCSAEQLLRQISYDKSVMSRTLQSLEKQELVRREINPKDERSRLFFLTETGIKQAKESMNSMQRWSEKTFSKLSPEEIEEFNILLHKVIE